MRFQAYPQIALYWWDQMFGWGKRRGSGRRAYTKVVVIQEDCPPGEEGSKKKPAEKPKQGHNDNGDDRGRDGDGEHRPVIRGCSPLQIAVTVCFSVGLTSTIGILLLGLLFHAGTNDPVDITVDHIAGSCLLRNSDIGDLASIAQQILPLRDKRGSRKEEEAEEANGDGSAITIYVPCPTYGDSGEGPDRSGGADYPAQRSSPGDLDRGGSDE